MVASSIEEDFRVEDVGFSRFLACQRTSQTKITRINVKGENGWLFSLSENRWSFIVCRGIAKTCPPIPLLLVPFSLRSSSLSLSLFRSLVIRLEAQFRRENDRNSITVLRLNNFSLLNPVRTRDTMVLAFIAIVYILTILYRCPIWNIPRNYLVNYLLERNFLTLFQGEHFSMVSRYVYLIVISTSQNLHHSIILKCKRLPVCTNLSEENRTNVQKSFELTVKLAW